MRTNRRNFIRTAAAGVASAAILPAYAISTNMIRKDMFFKISLAQWSLHKAFFSGELDNLDFPSVSAEKYGLDGVEYVNQFFPSSSAKYAKELLKRSDDAGVNNVLIMIDGEGDLGGQYAPVRNRAVEKHFEWVECAKTLGCHSIRVNAGGKGSEEAVGEAASASLLKLSEFAKKHEINLAGARISGGRAHWTNFSRISDVDLHSCSLIDQIWADILSKHRHCLNRIKYPVTIIKHASSCCFAYRNGFNAERILIIRIFLQANLWTCLSTTSDDKKKRAKNNQNYDAISGVHSSHSYKL